MKSYFSEIQLKHRPSSFLVNGVFEPCPEVPERALVLHGALGVSLLRTLAGFQDARIG